MRFAEISVAAGLLYILAGKAHATVAAFRHPRVVWKKQFPHPCQPCRHSCEGGNPDLRFSEISNDYCSVGCVHGYGLRQYQSRRVSYIFSRAKPTLRQLLAEIYKVVWKIPLISLANRAVIPAKAGIQTYGFQKYSTITVAWTLPTDMVYDNIGCGGSLIYSRGRSPRYGSHFQIPSSRLKKLPISLPAAPSFPRRRESRPLIFRNIQRLPQYGLCPQMRFAEILVSAGRLCFTGETLHIFRRRF